MNYGYVSLGICNALAWGKLIYILKPGHCLLSRLQQSCTFSMFIARGELRPIFFLALCVAHVVGDIWHIIFLSFWFLKLITVYFCRVIFALMFIS